MLVFIRKYQQLFFGFIAAVTIFSLLFFGAFSVLSFDEKPKDPIVAHTLNGEPLHLSEIKRLARFISSDREDLSSGGNTLPNLCNDGVVRYDLLRSGLAHLFVRDYFEPLKKGFESRLEKAKKFRPYVHPQTPNLSLAALWQRYLPKMNEDLEELRQESAASIKIFDLLSSLYQQQGTFPVEALRQILFMQQKQYPGLMADPKLKFSDLSLFGFHSISDWFGSDFLDLSAQFILQGASVAIEKGYKVSLEEAKADLALTFQNSIKKLEKSQLKELPSLTDHLRSLGFDFKSAAEVWRQVLLFRKYFQGIAQSTYIDRLPFIDFASYAKETALLDVYQWPAALRLKNFEDLVQFQIYLSMISPPSKDPLTLPSELFSNEIVEKKCPELVPTQYRVRWSELAIDEAALRVPTREVWDWELNEKNWKTLETRFKALSGAVNQTERLHRLELLTPKDRAEIDRFARRELIQAHPEWLSEGLNSKTKQEKVVFVSAKKSPWPHITQVERISNLLAQASQGDASAKEQLQAYSDDGQTVYRIETVELLGKSILTFGEARQEGILSDVVDQVLRAEHAKLKNSKFQDGKPFEEVREIVAKYLLSDHLKAIRSLEKKEWTDVDCAVYRLLAPARAALNDLKAGSVQCLMSNGDPLVEQFKLQKRECKIQRTAKEEWMKEAFMMVPDQWSPVQVAPTGEISFFYLSEKRAADAPILEQMVFGKETLGFDAQRYVATRFLERIKSKEAIVIPVKGEKE